MASLVIESHIHGKYRRLRHIIDIVREGFLRLCRLIITTIHDLSSEQDGYTRELDKDEIMILRLRRNDADAWEDFVRHWSPKLLTYLRYNLPTAEDAQDVLGETFAAAVKSIHRFDGRAAISTWLYTLAHHKMVDFWRQNQTETTELSDDLSIAEEYIGLDFRETFNRLPEQMRWVLLLRYREGLSVSEVAETMKRTYKATESLLSRARATFKQELETAGLIELGELE